MLVKDWGRVLFRNEPKFGLNPDDARAKVSGRFGEKYAKCNIVRQMAEKSERQRKMCCLCTRFSKFVPELLSWMQTPSL